MNTDNILKEVKLYFQFLFERGYVVRHISELPMGDREITLENGNNSIIIFSDRGEFDLAFGPINAERRNHFGIRGLVFFLSNGKEFIGKYHKSYFNKRKNQLAELANLLEEKIDFISPYFGKDFVLNKQDIIEAGKKYNDQYIEQYINQR